jgi:hypothetical protein
MSNLVSNMFTGGGAPGAGGAPSGGAAASAESAPSGGFESILNS